MPTEPVCSVDPNSPLPRLSNLRMCSCSQKPKEQHHVRLHVPSSQDPGSTARRAALTMCIWHSSSRQCGLNCRVATAGASSQPTLTRPSAVPLRFTLRSHRIHRPPCSLRKRARLARCPKLMGKNAHQVSTSKRTRYRACGHLPRIRTTCARTFVGAQVWDRRCPRRVSRQGLNGKQVHLACASQSLCCPRNGQRIGRFHAGASRHRQPLRL